MTPREQDALNRRLEREAADRQAAQNARIERDRQANEAANRKASQDQWRRFNEGQEKIRRDNEARHRKEQERREEHDKYMRKLREQQSWGGRSEQYVRPSPPIVDYVPPGSENIRTKKGGSAGKAVLFIIVAIFAIGYFGSHSDRTSSPSTVPEATTSSPTPAPSEPVAPLVEPAPAQPAPVQPAPEPALNQEPPPAQVQAPPVTSQQVAPQGQGEPAQPDSIPQQLQPPSLSLLSRVEPVYPALARQARFFGSVSILITVAPDGSVINARAEHGNPILAKAAIDAVQQWRYAPYTPIPGQAPLTSVANFNFNLP